MVLTLTPVCRECDGRGWYRMPDPAGRGDAVECEACKPPPPAFVPPSYRFDVTYLRGGTGDALTVSCAGLEADQAWRLARRMVEDDMPDGPIEAGREGKVDWTFPSLYQFAASAVPLQEVQRTPERLHPPLRASVVALWAARAARKAEGRA